MERNAVPSFDKFAERTEVVVATALDEQRHREVSGREPLAHLLKRKRTLDLALRIAIEPLRSVGVAFRVNFTLDLAFGFKVKVRVGGGHVLFGFLARGLLLQVLVECL